MNIPESTLASWAQGPGSTEAEKCSRAETAVRKAVAADRALAALDITVFPQGSYRARTNVPQESDVDICIRYNDSFFCDYAPGMTREDVGHEDSALKFSAFKGMVQSALENYFGKAAVTRGNKAFDVRENTYRLDADVVATFEHRRYTGDFSARGEPLFHRGVAFNPDDGGLVYNWPDQNYENGCAKNDRCGRSYKRLVRILKRLGYAMRDDGVAEARGIGSFLMECLVWNVADDAFTHHRYTDILQVVLARTFNGTLSDEACAEWGEVNELKYLLRGGQPWTRPQVNAFLGAAWDYMGYP